MKGKRSVKYREGRFGALVVLHLDCYNRQNTWRIVSLLRTSLPTAFWLILSIQNTLNKSQNLQAPIDKLKSAQLKWRQRSFYYCLHKETQGQRIYFHSGLPSCSTCYPSCRQGGDRHKGTAKDLGYSKVSLRSLGFYTEVSATEPHNW